MRLQIDTSNITNAFVSGMKEDLELYQNQYNYIVVAWTVGYIIGQWVSYLHSFKVVLELTYVAAIQLHPHSSSRPQ